MTHETDNAAQLVQPTAEQFAALWATMDGAERQRTHRLFLALQGNPLSTDMAADLDTYAQQLAGDPATAETGEAIRWLFLSNTQHP